MGKILRTGIILIIVISVIFFTEYYSLKGLNIVLKDYSIKGLGKYLYWGILPFLIILLVINFMVYPPEENPKSFINIFTIATLVILFVAPKLIIASFYVIENILYFILNLSSGLINYLFSSGFLLKRFHFISYTGVIAGVIMFFLLIYGNLIGRFDYKVNLEKLQFPDLPESFNSFKIVQISDLHIGSFYRKPGKVMQAVEQINKLEPDLIVFTGDLVNNFAEEAYPFIDSLKKLEARYGKYSILGNHDYGDYYNWSKEAKKKANLEKLKTYHKLMGFDLLLNENRNININGQSITLIGIENWGLPPFPQYGDLDKAIKNVEKGNFKILLSHDPSHWDAEVKGQTGINLTLSGHTHGMQMGIYNKKMKWSPVKWRYPKWGGLYRENGQYLYVNV